MKTDHERRLEHIVMSSDELSAALRAVRSLGLASWCIGAGAVRSLVWDVLHGFEERTPVDDIDVAFFDAEAAPDRDAELQHRLQLAMPSLHWEVTNQAHVHRWFAAALGQEVAPLVSLSDGLATWPEFATCVGVWLQDDDSLGVIAPHGLDDLFELRVRHNPRRASAATCLQRMQSKRFDLRWPRLSIELDGFAGARRIRPGLAYSPAMNRTGSVPPAAAWGSADAVFDRLEGPWLLEREITGGAEMKGTAVFRRRPDGLLAYHEQGRVRLPDGQSFEGHRDYFYEAAEGGFTVHFAETPMRVFHRIAIVAEAGGERMLGAASHLCVADTYDSRYAFLPDGSFTVEHTVSGPRKDYVTRTRFTRQA